MKLSKVKSVQGAGTYDHPQYGTFYKYEYTMETGETFVANHKSQKPFNAGDQVEYEIKGTNDHGSWGKISKPKEEWKKKGGGDLIGIKVGHALNCASVLLSGTKYIGDREQIKKAAKMIYEISEELNAELSKEDKPKPETKPAEKPQPAPPAEVYADDDLPF